MIILGPEATFLRRRTRALDVRLFVLAGLVLFGSDASLRVSREEEPGATGGPFAQVSADNLNTPAYPHTPVWSVAFSPTGRFLASATITGEVWFKDLATGELHLLDTGPITSAESVSFSPDGQILAVAGGTAVRMWHVNSRAELAPLEVPAGAKRIAFSPDGTLFALGRACKSGRNDVVIVKEWRGDRPLSVLNGLQGGVNALAFSASGTTVAAGYSSGLVRVWDVATGKERATLPAHGPTSAPVTALDWSPDGALLGTAAPTEAVVRLWKPASGELLRTVATTAAGVNALAFSPDGKILAMAHCDGSAILWDVLEAHEVKTLRPPCKSLWAVAFSRDGRALATGGGDGVLRVWDFAQALGGSPSSRVDAAHARPALPAP
jgi:WD40 repeat protein